MSVTRWYCVRTTRVLDHKIFANDTPCRTVSFCLIRIIKKFEKVHPRTQALMTGVDKSCHFLQPLKSPYRRSGACYWTKVAITVRAFVWYCTAITHIVASHVCVFGAKRVTRMKINQHYKQQKCSLLILVSANMMYIMKILNKLLKMASDASGLAENDVFSAFSRCIDRYHDSE